MVLCRETTEGDNMKSNLLEVVETVRIYGVNSLDNVSMDFGLIDMDSIKKKEYNAWTL